MAMDPVCNTKVNERTVPAGNIPGAAFFRRC